MRKSIFSKKLSELIKAKGITQKELAEYLNYSPETVSKYCRGDAEPSHEVLIKLAEYFKVTLDELIMDKKKDEYISPLALSIKEGVLSFREFIIRDKKNILKKDDTNKDFIDYLIEFSKSEELFLLIDCCFYIDKNASSLNSGYNYGNKKVRPSDVFAFAKVPEVKTRLQDMKDELLQYFIQGKCFDYAMQTDELIVNRRNPSKVKVNYNELVSLTIKNNAPIDVVKYFSKNNSLDQKLVSNYIQKCLEKDSNLVEEYKKCIFENFKSIVRDSSAFYKLSNYTEYLMNNKLNKGLKELYDVLFHYYYYHMKSIIDNNKVLREIPFGLNLYHHLKQLIDYCKINKEEKLWQEVIETEIANKVLNAKIYGYNMYHEIDPGIITVIKDRYNLKLV